MSRFLKPSVVVVPLGACQCPGTPHEQDEAVMHTLIGWDDLVDIGNADSEGAGQRKLVTAALKSWNLLDEDEDGNAVPVRISEETVRLLDPVTLEQLAQAASDAYLASRKPLPNASSAPSRRSPRGSASRRPTRSTPTS